MSCKKIKYTGRDVVLEAFIGCGDVLPEEHEWQRFGSMRTKEFNLEWDTIDATADDSVGALRENLASYQSLTISGDGTLKNSGAGAAFLIELNKHVANPVATGGQPLVWMRMTFPDITVTAFMLLSTFSRSAPYDDVATYSMEATATASDFGLIVEDTPVPGPAPASITVLPSSVTVEEGATQQLSSSVDPAGSNQAVSYSSADPGVASVDGAGLVTGVAEGSTTITVTSVAAPLVQATVAVTVTV